MTKRVLSLILAVLTALSLCAPAFASGEPMADVPAVETPAEDVPAADIPEPEVTAEPEDAPAPEVTPEPEVTLEPEVTAEPEATPEPEVTSEPEATPEPEVTPEPAEEEPSDEPETVSDITDGDYVWTINNNEATLKKYTGSASNLTVPASMYYSGSSYRVRTIGQYAFEDCAFIRTLTIPDSVTQISYGAFKNCTGLTSITINGTLKDCDYGTTCPFYNAGSAGSGLTVTFGGSVTRIPAHIFDTNSSKIDDRYAHVTSLTIGGSVQSVGSSAFAGCYDLASVTWNGSLESIDSYAFEDCPKISAVALPAAIKTLGYGAFKNCTGLTSITIDGTLKDCDYGTTCPFYNAGSAGVPLAVTIGGSVTRIPAHIFDTNSSKIDDKYAHVTALTIGGSVQSIGSSAFAGCYDLASVTWNGSLESIDSYAFEDCPKISAVALPAAIKTLGYGAFKNCTGLTSITIDGTLKDCDYGTTCPFYNAGSAGTALAVTFGSGATRIPAHIFDTNSSKIDDKYAHVTSLTIGGSVQSIGNSAFSECYDLASVTWNSRLENIDSYAFESCWSIPTVTLPTAIKSIGYGAFKNCTGLTGITINGTLKDCDYGTSCPFYNTGSADAPLTVTFGSAVTRIPAHIFDTNSSKIDDKYAHVTKLTIGSKVKSIGNSAFSECYDLASVTWNNSLESIDGYAFENCPRISAVTLPASFKTLGDDAFKNCTGLTSITVSGDMKNVSSGSYCPFYNAGSAGKGLTVTFGNSVTGIPANIFCTNSSKIDDKYAHVTRLVIGSNVKTIGNYAFCRCYDLVSVTVPDNVSTVGYASFDTGALQSAKVLNPRCTLDRYAFTGGALTVIGYDGSTAQTYARDYGCAFRSLGAPKAGLYNEDGKTYYYVSGIRQRGLVKAGSRVFYYCHPTDGHVLKDGWISGSGTKRYYADKNGKLYTGFKTIGSKSYYFSVQDAHMMRSGLVTGPNNQKYYVAKDGHALKNGWARGQAVKSRPGYSEYYYLDGNGVVRKTQQLPTNTKIGSLAIPKL